METNRKKRLLKLVRLFENCIENDGSSRIFEELFEDISLAVSKHLYRPHRTIKHKEPVEPYHLEEEGGTESCACCMHLDNIHLGLRGKCTFSDDFGHVCACDRFLTVEEKNLTEE